MENESCACAPDPETENRYTSLTLRVNRLAEFLLSFIVSMWAWIMASDIADIWTGFHRAQWIGLGFFMVALVVVLFSIRVLSARDPQKRSIWYYQVDFELFKYFPRRRRS